ncbi:DnaJ domain-containing protein [Thiocapsa bogorovii]|uniref:DnaJ domain-containing protein n=1 Tax=Thiocapsa bogorovii TaxID=521689 RepID=UPI001E2E4706|nr:DnaJ domain-containing protein [Thiocapsa bogorovii]UHD15501.1 DnaJ domain-containing protein [Thiocapsa bogorovii]
MAAPLVELALDYYRDPLTYRHLAEAERRLPQGFGALLAEFCTALSSARIAQTSAQLGADAAEMEEAARFFVRHALLNPEGDYYRHLGLNRDAPQESIRHHYQLLIRMFHPDRVEASTEFGAFYATRINQAYQTLRDPETRAAYDRGLPDLPAGFTETDPAWFFRPSLPVLAGKRPGRAPLLGGARGRTRRVGAMAVGAVMLGALVLGTGHVLIHANKKPALRLAASGSGETSAPLPSYLAPAARISGSDGRAADAPLPPLEPAPVAGVLTEQDRAGIRALEDAPMRLAPVPPRVAVSPIEPPIPTPTSSATSSRATPEEQASDAGPLGVDRLEVGRSESVRVVRAVPRGDLAKAREPEALMIPPVSAASVRPPAGGDVPPPNAIETQRPAEPMRLSAAPTQTVDPTPAPPETGQAVTLKSEPATQPKAELPELPKLQPNAQPRFEPPAPPKAAPKAMPPEALAKSASRRSEEPQADTSTPKGAAPAPTPAAPVQPVPSGAGAAGRGPSIVAGRPAATPEKDAANLVARLESAYAAMNADGFAALFTSSARVNEGSGRKLIRSKYADLFQRTTGAKLSISTVRWRSMPDGRISGSGVISVGNQYRGGGWRYAKGAVDLELVRDGGGYRIARMIYRLN